jgi:hypothetical protein
VNLFSTSANAMYWVAIAAAGATLFVTPALLIAWARTPYATGATEPPEQPVKFDHRHHVSDDGVDCLYCHADAARGPSAGIPATSVCMSCHAQVWTSSPELSAVRRSWFEGEPMRWTRVTSMPDFVFFDHSAHVNKGVGCASCHGRVDRMAQVFAAEPMTMRFCLDCHRAPERHLRPLDRVTDMDYQPTLDEGRELRARLGVRSLTHCTTCHR